MNRFLLEFVEEKMVNSSWSLSLSKGIKRGLLFSVALRSAKVATEKGWAILLPFDKLRDQSTPNIHLFDSGTKIILYQILLALLPYSLPLTPYSFPLIPPIFAQCFSKISLDFLFWPCRSYFCCPAPPQRRQPAVQRMKHLQQLSGRSQHPINKPSLRTKK